jgi:iron complex outermembrane recepter protein
MLGTRITRYFIAAAVTAAFTFGTAIASGAETARTGPATQSAAPLEEIMVTAEKREQRLMDVPLSITALTNADLERQGIDNMEDFARQIVGTTYVTQSANNGKFTIRGINTSPFRGSQQAPVAIYYDDLPIQLVTNSNVRPDMRLYDVERVEILRGPQGTGFGSGALAGAVRVITKKADLESFSAQTGVDFGSTPSRDSFRQRYNAMVNVPIVKDELALRLVGYYRDDEGYVDNVGYWDSNGALDKNVDSTVDYGGRASLRWVPNDMFTGTLTYLYQKSDPDDAPVTNPEYGKYVKYSYYPTPRQAEMSIINATLEWQFERSTLTSSSTYSDTTGTEWASYEDQTGSIPSGKYRPNFTDFVSEEARLVSNGGSRFDWIAGVFLLDTDTKTTDMDFVDQGYVDSLNITGITDGDLGTRVSYANIKESAAFGELSWHLSDTVTVTGGLRYTQYEQSVGSDGGDTALTALRNAVAAGGNTEVIFTVRGPAVDYKLSDSKWTSKWNISYRPDDDHTYYALASQGYRMGHGNANAGDVSDVDPTDLVIPGASTSDTLWNYELGAKTRWLDGKLQTNLALYYITWDDMQVQVRRLSDLANAFLNVGKSVSKGIELELQARPTDALDLGFNLTLQNAEVVSLTEEEAAQTGAYEGHPLPSPKTQVSGFAQYTASLANGHELYFRADAQHLEGFWNGFKYQPGKPGVLDPRIAMSDAYENVNASVGWLTDNWRLSAYVENLTDNDDIVGQRDTASHNQVIRLRPRTYGFLFVYDF